MFGKLGGTPQRYCSSFATPFECWQDRTITEQIRLMFIKCIDSKRSVGMTLARRLTPGSVNIIHLVASATTEYQPSLGDGGTFALSRPWTLRGLGFYLGV